MASVGLFEVIIVLAVALIVLGPDKLFTSIRYLGLILRKLRLFYSQVTDEFDRQLRLDEMLKNDQVQDIRKNSKTSPKKKTGGATTGKRKK